MLKICRDDHATETSSRAQNQNVGQMIAWSHSSMEADPTRDESPGANPIGVVWSEDAIYTPHHHGYAIQNRSVVCRARACVQLGEDDR
jgi:hypothetical protein